MSASRPPSPSCNRDCSKGEETTDLENQNLTYWPVIQELLDSNTAVSLVACSICDTKLTLPDHPQISALAAADQPTEMGIILPDCNHVIGVLCLETWLDATTTPHPNCPICRTQLSDAAIRIVRDMAATAARKAQAGENQATNGSGSRGFTLLRRPDLTRTRDDLTRAQEAISRANADLDRAAEALSRAQDSRRVLLAVEEADRMNGRLNEAIYRRQITWRRAYSQIYLNAFHDAVDSPPLAGTRDTVLQRPVQDSELNEKESLIKETVMVGIRDILTTIVGSYNDDLENQLNLGEVEQRVCNGLFSNRSIIKDIHMSVITTFMRARRDTQRTEGLTADGGNWYR